MNPWIIVLIIIASLVIALIARCVYEVHTIVSVTYNLRSSKISEGSALRAIFLTDLHGRTYKGKMLKLIKKAAPDVILIGGDLIVSKDPSKDKSAYKLLEDIQGIAPIYYAPGNHEKAAAALEIFKDRYTEFRTHLNEYDIKYLSNESVLLKEGITLTGLDTDYEYYNKIHPKKLDKEAVESYVGNPDQKMYNIILAHSPAFFDACQGAGFDLVLSGHYHGGAVRLPLIGGIVSPQFKLLPGYTRGLYIREKSDLIVSAGCGSHTVNLRIMNKPELVIIELDPER